MFLSVKTSRFRAVYSLGSAKWICLLLFAFVVLLPKGGFKVAEIPITWGYIFIFLFGGIAIPWAALDINRFRLPALTLYVWGCLTLFQGILLLSFMYGISSGFAFSAVINFFLLPFILLILWRRWYSPEMIALALRALRFCVYAAAIYGIFLFVFRLATGKMIEIPFLTVNAGDFGMIESKDNLRSKFIMKLVSTYNNGNIYGAATILLLPLFDHLESRRMPRIVMRVALLLTLSRTAWFGLFLDQFLNSYTVLRHSFRGPLVILLKRFKKLSLPLLTVVLILPLVIGLTLWMPGGLGMLTDTSLGGRSGIFDALHTFTLLPALPFLGFAEMVFLSALQQLGLIGFLAMLNLFLCPLWFGYIDRTLRASPVRKAAVKGLLLYSAIAWIDGAISYIPVMAFYWFVTAIAIYAREEDKEGMENRVTERICRRI